MSRQLQEALLSSHLEDILDDVLAGNATATDSAAKAASMVISQEDVSRAFDNFLASYFKAIESMANEPSLTLLVDYIVALASLPDAYNEGPEPKKISIGGDEIKIINPGESIAWYERSLWRGLAGFSMLVTESFQGTLSLILLCNTFTNHSTQVLSCGCTLSARRLHQKLQWHIGET